VPVYLGVVSIFVLSRVQPPQQRANGNQHHGDGNYLLQAALAASGARRNFLLLVRLLQLIRFGSGGVSLLSAKLLLGIAIASELRSLLSIGRGGTPLIHDFFSWPFSRAGHYFPPK
jgi:hypothetical protein